MVYGTTMGPVSLRTTLERLRKGERLSAIFKKHAHGLLAVRHLRTMGATDAEMARLTIVSLDKNHTAPADQLLGPRFGDAPHRGGDRDRYVVTVSGDGTVYSGNNRREAQSSFSRYARKGLDKHVTMYDLDVEEAAGVVKEHEPMTTLFLTAEGYSKAERQYNQLMELLGRDVGLGNEGGGSAGAWINVMTEDPKIVARAVTFLGKRNVREIAGDVQSSP